MIISRSAVCGLTVCLLGGVPTAGSAANTAPLVDIRSVDSSIVVDLRYNTDRNSFHRRFYHSNVALLRRPVAARLAQAQARLRKQGLGLKLWDAYRPTSVQYALWKAHPGTRFLSNPRKGSKHSRGAAVDVTLVDVSGKALEMPTGHDEFSARAYRGAVRGVSVTARRHSGILEAAMRGVGFTANRYEWWHFTAPDWQRYPLSNTPLPPDGPSGK